MKALKKIKHRLISWLFPAQAHKQQQKKWNAKWSDPDFDPAWRISAIPQELKDAVENEWFPAKASILDIGCGSGEVSSWLAEQGFTVLGVDIAEGAIQRARLRNADKQDKLSFNTLDICRQSTAPKQFEVLVGRGCLHTINPEFMPDYVKNIAASASQGARFLLFHKVEGKKKDSSPNLIRTSLEELQEVTIEKIKRNFQPTFEILEIKPIVLTCSSGKNPRDPMPALAIRMIRS